MNHRSPQGCEKPTSGQLAFDGACLAGENEPPVPIFQPASTRDVPRVKNDILVSVAFGAGLVLLGGFLTRWHFRVWRAHRSDPGLEPREIGHYRGQLLRRLQVSLLLITLGFLIPIGDALMSAGKLTRAGSALWIIMMLGLSLWIMVLGALDWLSSRLHRRAATAALASLARKRRDLEDEVTRLRAQRNNGHASPNVGDG
jgi:hypothetical protein